MTKRTYITPALEEVRLDNEISLQLASTPPVNPRENASGSQGAPRMETYESDPYQYDNW